MDRRDSLLVTAFGLAGFSVLVHAVLGASGIVDYVTGDGALLLPLLFLVGAGLVVLISLGFVRGVLAPPAAYLAGGVLMLSFVVAYADVHAFQFAENVLGIETGHDHGHGHENGHNGHDHDGDDGHDHDGHEDDGHGHDDGHDHDDDSNVDVLIDHLRDDLTALTTKIAETASAVAFFGLYVLER